MLGSESSGTTLSISRAICTDATFLADLQVQTVPVALDDLALAEREVLHLVARFRNELLGLLGGGWAWRRTCGHSRLSHARDGLERRLRLARRHGVGPRSRRGRARRRRGRHRGCLKVDHGKPGARVVRERQRKVLRRHDERLEREDARLCDDPAQRLDPAVRLAREHGAQRDLRRSLAQAHGRERGEHVNRAGDASRRAERLRVGSERPQLGVLDDAVTLERPRGDASFAQPRLQRVNQRVARGHAQEEGVGGSRRLHAHRDAPGGHPVPSPTDLGAGSRGQRSTASGMPSPSVSRPRGAKTIPSAARKAGVVAGKNAEQEDPVHTVDIGSPPPTPS